MTYAINKEMLLEDFISKETNKLQKNVFDNLPLDYISNKNDEKEILKYTHPLAYKNNTINTYKILGAVGGASMGVKLAPEIPTIVSDDLDGPALLATQIGSGILGFGLGAKLGSSVGKNFGESISNRIIHSNK